MFVYFLEYYDFMLMAHPIWTKCLTSLVMMCLSDILAQIITKNTKNCILRNLRFSLWGFCFGCLAHYYLTYVNRIIPGKAFASVILKIAIDQLIWSPIANTLFFLFISILEDPLNQPNAGITSLRKNLWNTLKINIMIWTPVQFLNFMFVNVNYQVFVINLVNLFWNCYLAIVASRTFEYKKVGENDSKI